MIKTGFSPTIEGSFSKVNSIHVGSFSISITELLLACICVKSKFKLSMKDFIFLYESQHHETLELCP